VTVAQPAPRLALVHVGRCGAVCATVTRSALSSRGGGAAIPMSTPPGVQHTPAPELGSNLTLTGGGACVRLTPLDVFPAL